MLYKLQISSDAASTLQGFIIAGGLLIFLFTILFLIFFIYSRQKQNKMFLIQQKMKQTFSQQLLQSQLETQEETFNTISKEIHDNVAQLLSSTKMLIGVTERSMTNPPDTLIMADDTLSKAIAELRSLSKSLNKEWLEQFNFIENLNAEAARINTSKIINIHFNHPEKLLLKADEQIILFRIVQEAIQNALKHAKAQNIDITIAQNNLALNIVITDDGEGFNIEVSKKGLGITNIKHRTQLLGGTVEWTSTNNGTKIIIQLPVKETDI